MAIKPLSSYPKEFHVLWDLATQGVLNIPFPSKGAAVSFRSRMYSFRKRAMEEAPAIAEPWKEVDISAPVCVEDASWRLQAVILPWKRYARENAMLPALTPQVVVPVLPSQPSQPALLQQETLPDAMDSTLKNLGFGVDLGE